MSHTIFLTPLSAVPQSVVQLAEECKTSLLSMLQIRIMEEELRPSADNKTFTSKHPTWLAIPAPKITTISDLGIETLKFISTDYTQSLTNGSITFGTATTNIVRADYFYFPFTDAQLADLTLHSLQEISILIYRPINENLIEQDYLTPICQRLYTNVLKALLVEARDYFTVSVGGRSVNKSNIVTQITGIIEENEKQLQEAISTLRIFNKTNRVLPVFTSAKNLNSAAQIV